MAEKKIIEEIIDFFNVEFNDFNASNDINIEYFRKKLEKLNLDKDVNHLILLLMTKLKEINETKNIIYEFIFSINKKEGDEQIKKRISSDLVIKEKKIINEFRNFIQNIKNKEKEKIENEIYELKSLFEEYTSQIFVFV